jgi:hypothetical protein
MCRRLDGKRSLSIKNRGILLKLKTTNPTDVRLQVNSAPGSARIVNQIENPNGIGEEFRGATATGLAANHNPIEHAQIAEFDRLKHWLDAQPRHGDVDLPECLFGIGDSLLVRNPQP